MRVWIDLSNSPHPLLFAPIASRLGELGHEVLVTARDNAQTVELALERWPSVEVIGGSSPRARTGKLAAVARRVRGLQRWAAGSRPDIALSHNSYAQIVAARLRGIRVITAMDFEHQPANNLAFRLADRILVPEALDHESIRKQGASASKVRRYGGLKEEIYLGDFEPDAGMLAGIGIQRRNGTIVVVARTPPSRATYHRFGNPLFVEVLEALGRQPAVELVVLARHPEQRATIATLALQNCTVPGAAIDSRSLMYEADLVVGAGGTMTREAALLGVPTVSLFAGRSAGVDRWLEQRKALRRVTRLDEIVPAQPRATQPRTIEELRERARTVVQAFLEAAIGPLAAGTSGGEPGS
jgi:predicted glycosyltransferase